jgi:hypothetical protein
MLNILGIQLFDEDVREKAVASIMVLTDGMPNHMCVENSLHCML